MLKLITIQAGQFINRNGIQTYILFGMSDEGNVYRWSDKFDGWIALSMEEKYPENDPLVYNSVKSHLFVEANS